MKRKPSLVPLKGLAAALAIIAASTVVDAQVTVSVPFKFEAGGKSFPPGEYSIDLKKNGADGVVVLTTSGKHEHRTVTGRVTAPSR